MEFNYLRFITIACWNTCMKTYHSIRPPKPNIIIVVDYSRLAVSIKYPILLQSKFLKGITVVSHKTIINKNPLVIELIHNDK